MRKKEQLSWQKGLVILGLIWLMGAICDRFWYALDHSVPAWDQADYLNGVLNYAEALQTPQWLSGEWWRSFWLLSNKIPPLNYILTAPLVNLFGTTEDVATLIMLLYSGILLVSVYGLGIALFDATTGLWAAGLCQLIPGLYYHRLEFILDYPLTSAVTFSFWLLTVYSFSQDKIFSWILGILWGISFGLAILMKQTALFFLFLPLLGIFTNFLWKRQWLRLLQLASSLIVGIAVAFPWYRTNWLLILTSGKRATIDSAIAEGDPALNTLDAWTYYAKVLPYLLSWHLLLIPLLGLLIYLVRKYFYQRSNTKNLIYSSKKAWMPIGVFFLGGYFLSSLNINKDARYILPLLPVLSLVLAVGLLSWRSRWQKYVLGIIVSLGIILMLLNIFFLGGNTGNAISTIFNPRTQHHPYTGKPYPHPEVIAQISNTSPYLRTVLGVLPSTTKINQHNFSFYGKQSNAHISGRQVGVRESEILPDSRSLDWFITKTGDQGSIPESQPAMVELVEQGKGFRLQKSWQLPGNSQLKLYHRDRPLVEVSSSDSKSLSLSVETPSASIPGVPIPVTYSWTGDRQALASGMVLLTWRHETTPDVFWIHDHSIAMGALISQVGDNSTLKVLERTAMQPPANIQPGRYYLEATYLNRDTKAVQSIDTSSAFITIDSQATATPAPELDLVSQLRNIAPKMADNIQGLDPVFAQTARINQYDAQQDYLKQAELSLSYRLQSDRISCRQQLDWLYAIALSQVLQQDVDGAITSFQKITALEPKNPYGYAYLAFVHLYDWQPKLAEIALDTATKINPNITEVKTLRGAAAVMQGRFIKAWKLFND